MKQNPDLTQQLAYSLPSLAKACDVSVDTIRHEIDAGRLERGYLKSKPVVSRAAAERWLANLPTAKPAEKRAS